MIRNIIFDVGRVLVDFRWRETMEDHGITGERLNRLRRATLGSPMWNELDRSSLSDPEILERFIQNDPEIEGDIRLMWQHNREMIRCYDYSHDWIRSLKKKGYSCYILSNYARYTYGQTREELSFEELMDGSIFSWQVQQVKPEPAIFETLLERFSLKPAECVFLDDTRANVEAARALGIRGIVFESYGQAREELKRLGVE
ncbi:MAG: HAD family phosphatase [Lachnospiraceae bacterium]|nr:HAD family phosphatase [Lachnospiraceae bacterium]